MHPKFTGERFEAPVYFRYDLESLIQTAAEICGQLAAVSDLDELLEQTVSLLRQTLGYDQVTLYLLDSKSEQFSLKVTANGQYGRIRFSEAVAGESSLAYQAVRQNCSVQIGDLLMEVPEYYCPTLPDIRSELHIPLAHQRKVWGVLSLGSTATYMFDQPDVIFVLRALATQIAIAIHRLRQQPEETKVAPPDEPTEDTLLYSHVASVRNILSGIQQLSGINDVFDKIVQGVVAGLGYTGAMLAALDEERQTLSVQAIALNNFTHRHDWSRVEKLFGVQIIDNSVSLTDHQSNMGVQTCLTGETRVTHDLYDLFQPIVDPKLCYRIQRSIGLKSCLSIPLLVDGRAVGNLYVGSRKNRILQADIEALQFFVTNAAIAVQNSLVFEQLNQKLALRESELIQLRSIERTINSSLDLREVLKRILDGALNLIGAEYGQVVLAGKYATDLVRQVSFPEILDSFDEIKFGITQAIMQEKKPKLITNTATQQPAERLEEVISSGGAYSKVMKSLLGVPILLENELIGVINITSQEANAFDEQSLEMLEQLAVQAAIAINNAYQFKAEQEMRERFANVAQVVAMGDMASNMVHSINNQVGSIRADINYLKRQHTEGKSNENELLELLDDMLENAEATLSMAENIRKPFQPSPQEPIDVNECIRSVLQEKENELSSVIVIEELQEIPPVMATRQLELVFENLLNNALIAMKDQVRGVLKFATTCSADGQWVQVIVQDSGPGLAESLSEKDIFKLGVSGRKEGLGYGLWWCDTFLKRWGGQIQFVENTRRGCKFSIKIPTATKGRDKKLWILNQTLIPNRTTTF